MPPASGGRIAPIAEGIRPIPGPTNDPNTTLGRKVPVSPYRAIPDDEIFKRIGGMAEAYTAFRDALLIAPGDGPEKTKMRTEILSIMAKAGVNESVLEIYGPQLRRFIGTEYWSLSRASDEIEKNKPKESSSGTPPPLKIFEVDEEAKVREALELSKTGDNVHALDIFVRLLRSRAGSHPIADDIEFVHQIGEKMSEAGLFEDNFRERALNALKNYSSDCKQKIGIAILMFEAGETKRAFETLRALGFGPMDARSPRCEVGVEMAICAAILVKKSKTNEVERVLPLAGSDDALLGNIGRIMALTPADAEIVCSGKSKSERDRISAVINTTRQVPSEIQAFYAEKQKHLSSELTERIEKELRLDHRNLSTMVGQSFSCTGMGESTIEVACGVIGAAAPFLALAYFTWQSYRMTGDVPTFLGVTWLSFVSIVIPVQIGKLGYTLGCLIGRFLDGTKDICFGISEICRDLFEATRNASMNKAVKTRLAIQKRDIARAAVASLLAGDYSHSIAQEHLVSLVSESGKHARKGAYQILLSGILVSEKAECELARIMTGKKQVKHLLGSGSVRSHSARALLGEVPVVPAADEPRALPIETKSPKPQVRVASSERKEGVRVAAEDGSKDAAPKDEVEENADSGGEIDRADGRTSGRA